MAKGGLDDGEVAAAGGKGSKVLHWRSCTPSPHAHHPPKMRAWLNRHSLATPYQQTITIILQLKAPGPHLFEPSAAMAHVSLPLSGANPGGRRSEDIGRGQIFDSSAFSSSATTDASSSGGLPSWSTTRSQYHLPQSEVLKGLANRFVHSTSYLYLYASMAFASLLTVVMSLMTDCPGTMFYVVEMLVNVVLVVEVGVRFVAFGRVSSEETKAIELATRGFPFLPGPLPLPSLTAILALHLQHPRSLPRLPLHPYPTHHLLFPRLLSLQSWLLQGRSRRQAGQGRGAAGLLPLDL